MTKHAALRTASRRRLTVPAVAAGVVGSVAIAASMGASLSGLTATINNTTNTSASATLAVQETSGATVCKSYDTTATCDTINKYGGTGTPLAPGGSKSTTVTFQNTGQVAVGSATLTPSACVASSTGATGSTTPPTSNTSASNLCSVMQVAVYKGSDSSGTAIYSGSMANFTSAPAAKDLSLTLAAANGNTFASQAFTFVVSLPAGATTAVQGQQVSQPLLWTFNQ